MKGRSKVSKDATILHSSDFSLNVSQGESKFVTPSIKLCSVSSEMRNTVAQVVKFNLKFPEGWLVGRSEIEIISNFWYINSAVGRFEYVLGVGIYKHTLAISVTSSLGKAWLSILFNSEHIVSSSINNEHIFTACFMFHNEVTFTTLTVTLKCFPTSL